MSARAMREGMRRLREAGDATTFEGWTPTASRRSRWRTTTLDAMVDGTEFFDAKMDAMRAHASQIATDGPFFAFSNNVGNRVWGHEFYRLVKGTAPRRRTAGSRTTSSPDCDRPPRSVLLGAYVGLIGALVHRHRVESLGVDWPWGTLLAVGAAGALRCGRRVIGFGASWFGIGWSVVLLGQALSPSGSYLVASDWLGYVYSLLGPGVARGDDRAEL